jgi:hypothetical protein
MYFCPSRYFMPVSFQLFLFHEISDQNASITILSLRWEIKNFNIQKKIGFLHFSSEVFLQETERHEILTSRIRKVHPTNMKLTQPPTAQHIVKFGDTSDTS